MTQARSIWQNGVKTGIIGGVAVLIIALVGMVQSFNKRDIIFEVVAMGHILLLIVTVLMGYIAAKRTPREDGLIQYVNAVVCSLITSGFLALLVIAGRSVNLRSVLVNASPVLYKELTLGIDGAAGILVILLLGAAFGAVSALLYYLPPAIRRVTVMSVSMMIGAGVLQELIRPVLLSWGPMAVIADYFYTANGLTIVGAITIVVAIAAGMTLWTVKGDDVKSGYGRLSGGSQRGIKIGSFIALAFVLIVLPHVLGLFLSEVLTIVGLYVLLGLGLNIVVGYAGMLDLGYVAFFCHRLLCDRRADLARTWFLQFDLLAGPSICGRPGYLFRHSSGNPGAQDAGRLSGHRHPRLW